MEILLTEGQDFILCPSQKYTYCLQPTRQTMFDMIVYADKINIRCADNSTQNIRIIEKDRKKNLIYYVYI